MNNKCVFVIGPESSGSKLVARICSHVLQIQDFDDWNGTAWSDRGEHKVCHRSLPYNLPPKFPDIEEWISTHHESYDLCFILTTRDITLSELSRIERFSKSKPQVEAESAKAREIMLDVLRKPYPVLIWSYETFMFLGLAYLKQLYQFLGVQSDFCPPIIDGNRKRLEHPIKPQWLSWIQPSHRRG